MNLPFENSNLFWFHHFWILFPPFWGHSLALWVGTTPLLHILSARTKSENFCGEKCIFFAYDTAIVSAAWREPQKVTSGKLSSIEIAPLLRVHVEALLQIAVIVALLLNVLGYIGKHTQSSISMYPLRHGKTRTGRNSSISACTCWSSLQNTVLNGVSRAFCLC